MRPLGDALAARGFPVRGVLLPGHGTTVEDLGRTRWTDWRDAVVGEAERLAADTRAVAAVGMTLGGLLALHLAATRPDLVRALVVCGTPIESAALRVRLLPWLARVPWFAARWATIGLSGLIKINYQRDLLEILISFEEPRHACHGTGGPRRTAPNEGSARSRARRRRDSS